MQKKFWFYYFCQEKEVNHQLFSRKIAKAFFMQMLHIS